MHGGVEEEEVVKAMVELDKTLVEEEEEENEKGSVAAKESAAVSAAVMEAEDASASAAALGSVVDDVAVAFACCNARILFSAPDRRRCSIVLDSS